ncbi:MAG: hypothetical protein WA397_18700 [Roseiarcus sp.]
MRKAFILSIAVGVALTAPVAAHQQVSGHRTHHWSALGNATALASKNLYRPVHSRTTHPVTVASQWVDPFKPRTTNGLSSNRNACASYGCVGAGGGGD